MKHKKIKNKSFKFQVLSFKTKGVAALITVLSLGGLILVIGLSSAIISFWANQNIKSTRDSNKAYYAAYSGIQDALLKLERNKDYTSTGYNLSINGVNDVSVTVSFSANQATINSNSTLGQTKKKLQTIADINSTTGLITPTSTEELTL